MKVRFLLGTPDIKHNGNILDKLFFFRYSGEKKKEVSMGEYSCPDCDGAQIEFLRVSAAGIHFFCHYCCREKILKNTKPEYLPNLVVKLRKKYPARQKTIAVM